MELFLLLDCVILFAALAIWKQYCWQQNFNVRYAAQMESINRELTKYYNALTQMILLAKTTDERTKTYPQFEDNQKEFLRRLVEINKELKAASESVTYMKILKERMDTQEKEIANKIGYVEQLSAGVVKSGIEIVERYEPTVNMINLLSSRIDGLCAGFKRAKNARRKQWK